MKLRGHFTPKTHETIVPISDEIENSDSVHEKFEICDIPEELQDNSGEQAEIELELETRFGKFCLGLEGLTY